MCRSARCSRAGSTRRSSSPRWPPPSAEPVRTFTIGYPDAAYDERAHARLVAERFSTRHEELEVDPQPELLDRVAEAFDEPFGDEAALPMLLLCEATRRHVTVALVGDGGDESFGGYERYRAHALAGRIPRPLAALGASALGAVPAARREPRSTPFRARRFLDAAAQPPAARYARLMEVFPLELRRALWTDEARAQAAESLLPHDPDLRLVDIGSYLPGDLLPKSDIASMAESLELRSPLLDHHVVELGLALPPSLASGKAALARAFADDLPAETLSRPKTGFGVPLDAWFRGELAGHGPTTSSSALPTEASSAVPSSNGCYESTTNAERTMATASGASAPSSSGSDATSTAESRLSQRPAPARPRRYPAARASGGRPPRYARCSAPPGSARSRGGGPPCPSRRRGPGRRPG